MAEYNLDGAHLLNVAPDHSVADRIYPVGVPIPEAHAFPVVLRRADEEIVAPPLRLLERSERMLPAPMRPIGIDEVETAEAAGLHWERYGTSRDTLAVWRHGDVYTAIYNSHMDAEQAGWSDYGCKLRAVASPQFKRWHALCGGDMSQEEFAEALEHEFDDLTSPPDGRAGLEPLQLVTLLQDLAINATQTYKKRFDPHSGEYHLTIASEHGNGEVAKIPRSIWIGAPVLRDEAPFRIEIRIYMTLRPEKGATFRLRMHNRDRIWDAARDTLRDKLEELLDVKIIDGQPATPGLLMT